jgi:precorrin-4 methylase
MERVDDEKLELVTTIARRIWHRKNTVVYRGDLIHRTHLVKCPKDSVEEFHHATQFMGSNTEGQKRKEGKNRGEERPKLQKPHVWGLK